MKVKDLENSELQYFYGTYLNALNEEEDLKSALENGKKNFQQLIENLTKDQLMYSYGEGKWTIAEVLVHLIDSERVFQYRAFRISRNDKTPLPGFEQDDYVLESYANQRTKEDILQEFLIVREASINFFSLLSNDVFKRTGTASGLPWSVAALGLVISGHQRHHFNIIKERYLV
ncbi:DinB family protein [Maribacter sp. 1_2014MBL_MicDiv]|uniref:DinB family protein n=1 Tax=Maribacter sp. 1_2014MBL_MicDiv TaxID=1644130 RepID=UPI0008F48B44|nr:DinB family protein [Maribacter sp. 1_2014MBL_MicDiv]APA65817.1 damage-inducible protein DinB [Maribacter sp. 1_2014MBL_MicDiv]